MALTPCRELAEGAGEKPFLNQFGTGVLTQSESGEIAFTYGSILHSHSSLIDHATRLHGQVVEILWAGEIESSENQIQTFNETAGILVRATPLIHTKVSNVENLKFYYDHDPAFRRLFSSQPRLIHYDPAAPDSGLHLFSGLKDISTFRHDIRGAFAIFSGLASLLKAHEIAAGTQNKLRPMIIEGAKKALKLLSIAEMSHIKPPQLDPTVWDKIIETFQKIEQEGFSHEVAEDRERFDFLSKWMDLFNPTPEEIHSIRIEIGAGSP